MKKILLFSLFVFFLGLAPHAFAQGFVALAPIPGLTDTGSAVVNAASLAAFFNNLYKYLIGLAAALAVIMIIWGGLEISTQDSISKQGEGREKIKAAIFGLILVLSPALVFSIINPSILNLSLNLQALDTRSVQTSPSANPYTLSETETQLRESSGGAVVSSFTIDQNASARSIGQILDTKQAECSSATGGLGVILPGTETGGGSLHYVCQTCPPNTTPRIFPTGAAGAGPRGSCQTQ